MLQKLKTLFGDIGLSAEVADNQPTAQLAAAALLIEAAMLDGHFSGAERIQIEAALREVYGLDAKACERLIERAEAAAVASVEWQGFTSSIKDACDHDERVQIVEMLWRVALADDELHDYEASLIRRICGLLYVSGRESAQARERARQRLES